MRPLQLIQIGALLALTLTACNSKTTYSFPTETISMRARTPAQEDFQPFYNSYNAFVKQNADEHAIENDNFLFPVLSSYQTGLTILASAESKSYQEAARFLRTDAPDEYPLVQCFNPILIDLKKRQNLKFGSSLWMIWPIPLEKPFSFEMAEKLSSDIIRLGNTGVTAHNAMDRWLQKFEPEIKIKNPGLERNESIMSVGVTTLTLNLSLSKTETPDGQKVWIATDDQFAFVAWKADNNLNILSPKQFHLLLQNIISPHPGKESRFVTNHETNLTKSLEALDCNQILTGPNNFRNLSVEIIPEGDRIGIPYLRQHAALTLNFQGENPFEGSEPISYAVLDKKSEMPILIGKHTPK